MLSLPNQSQRPGYEWTMRRIFWFEKGELGEIITKLTALRWPRMGDERHICEFNVLSTLVLTIPLAFFTLAWWDLSMWWGLLSLWGFKEAVQCLNEKRFFDPLP
jgi:hypothetical protein